VSVRWSERLVGGLRRATPRETARMELSADRPRAPFDSTRLPGGAVRDQRVLPWKSDPGSPERFVRLNEASMRLGATSSNTLPEVDQASTNVDAVPDGTRDAAALLQRLAPDALGFTKCAPRIFRNGSSSACHAGTCTSRANVVKWHAGCTVIGYPCHTRTLLQEAARIGPASTVFFRSTFSTPRLEHTHPADLFLTSRPGAARGWISLRPRRILRGGAVDSEAARAAEG